MENLVDQKRMPRPTHFLKTSTRCFGTPDISIFLLSKDPYEKSLPRQTIQQPVWFKPWPFHPRSPEDTIIVRPSNINIFLYPSNLKHLGYRSHFFHDLTTVLCKQWFYLSPFCVIPFWTTQKNREKYHDRFWKTNISSKAPTRCASSSYKGGYNSTYSGYN